MGDSEAPASGSVSLNVMGSHCQVLSNSIT